MCPILEVRDNLVPSVLSLGTQSGGSSLLRVKCFYLFYKLKYSKNNLKPFPPRHQKISRMTETASCFQYWKQIPFQGKKMDLSVAYERSAHGPYNGCPWAMTRPFVAHDQPDHRPQSGRPSPMLGPVVGDKRLHNGRELSRFSVR